jgi:hypothetical protein
MNKTYLGDDVYATIDPSGSLILTTSNGTYTTNAIVVEPAVQRALLAFLKKVRT